jgi:hypothetical protein
MCSCSIVPTDHESESSVASSINHVNISIYACGIGFFQRSLYPIVPSLVILVLSYNNIFSCMSCMCSSSSIVRTPPGIVEPSIYPHVVPYILPRMHGCILFQPSSVVTHVRVRTGDQKSWSVNASSILMLSCRYASFYVYLLSIYCLDASSIVWLNTLIGICVRSWLACLNPRGLLSFGLQQCHSASWCSLDPLSGILSWSLDLGFISVLDNTSTISSICAYYATLSDNPYLYVLVVLRS